MNARIEIYRQQQYDNGPVWWDIYVDHHFVDRYYRLADAKRRAETRAAGDGRWHRKKKSAIRPVRYWLEVGA
jgi:hypothetical protein